MNREEFLSQLERLLYDIPAQEREEALEYYNGYFDDAGNEKEAEVIQELGSPGKVAAIIKADLSGNEADYEEYTEQGYQDEKTKRSYLGTCDSACYFNFSNLGWRRTWDFRCFIWFDCRSAGNHCSNWHWRCCTFDCRNYCNCFSYHSFDFIPGNFFNCSRGRYGSSCDCNFNPVGLSLDSWKRISDSLSRMR